MFIVFDSILRETKYEVGNQWPCITYKNKDAVLSDYLCINYNVLKKLFKTNKLFK